MMEWIVQTTTILVFLTTAGAIIFALIKHYSHDQIFQKDVLRRLKRIEKNMGIEEDDL